jgi:hypothetical protein
VYPWLGGVWLACGVLCCLSIGVGFFVLCFLFVSLDVCFVLLQLAPTSPFLQTLSTVSIHRRANMAALVSVLSCLLAWIGDFVWVDGVLVALE